MMSHSEYIRPVSGQSQGSILGIPIGDSTATLTFLHAGRPRWAADDGGPSVVTEHGHSHEVYHAILHTEGRNSMIHDGRIHACERGTFVLTDPNSVHEYRPQSPGGAAFIEITFNLTSARRPVTLSWNRIMSLWLGEGIVPLQFPMLLLPPALDRIESRMNGIVDALTGGLRYRESTAALRLGGLILDIVEHAAGEERRSAGREDRILRTRKFLEENYASDITNADLASIACLSVGAFIRAFSARFGISPMAYRRQLRITAARHLLSVSGRSVGEVAASVGYPDIYSFSRSFRNLTGRSASAWRSECRLDSRPFIPSTGKSSP